MGAPSSPLRQYPIYNSPFYPVHNFDTTYYSSIYSSSPSSSSPLTPAERLQRDFGNNLLDYGPSIDYSARPVPIINLAPHINLQRAPEPASPNTTPTTLPAHSSPSLSPSGVTVMSANHSPPGFQLYDEGMPISAENRRQKLAANRRYDSASNISPTSNSRFASGVSISVPQSGLHMSQAGLPPYYPPFIHENNFSSQQRQYLQTPQQYRTQGLSITRARPMVQTQSHGSEDDDLPALSPHGQSQFSTSSRPSLSDADLHSPATPIASPRSGNGTETCGASVPAVHIHTPTPKLGRTISDAYQDELFNPETPSGTSATPQPGRRDSGSAPSKLPTFLQQAQTQRSAVGATPRTTRDHSPFRANSPFYPARSAQFSIPQSPSRCSSLLPVGFATARAQREEEMVREAEMITRQFQRGYEGAAEAPKTISPKDAFLEYCEPEEEGTKGTLSPREDEYAQSGCANGQNCESSAHGDGDDHEGGGREDDACSDQSFGIKTEESFGSMATSRRDSEVSMGFNTPLYPSGSQQFAQSGYSYGFASVNMHRQEGHASGPVSRGSAMEEEHDYNIADSPRPKPVESRADRGVYTCTVSGCSKRFPTPNKMSKHRREMHRQSTPLTVRSHHQGPHKCTRINPSTNKPCNSVFSRPYDLTRHEDTIHNTNRQKVRCELCNDEKTFSRQDALTRHKKVKHGIDK